MRPIARLVVALCLVLSVGVVVARAQQPSAPSVGLVSPGGVDQTALTSGCTTFSWAPGDTVAGYELAVFELDATKQPKSAPVLHVPLSGRATSWTPSAADCLKAGQDFGWYMREIKQQGEKPGKWSPALTFSVLDSSKPAGTKVDGSEVQAAPGDNPGNGGPPPTTNPNTEIINRLTAIETQLTTLLANSVLNPRPVSRETCFELGAELEGGFDGEAKVLGGAKGEGGAWAFGNGLIANIQAVGELKLAAALKGAAAIKRSWCWDPLIQPFGATQAAPASSTAVADTLSDTEFTSRLAAMTEGLRIGDDRIRAAMDLLPAINVGADPWASLRGSSPLTAVADVLPMPEGIRTSLRDPAQIVANFRAQMNLCAQSDLPPAVAGLVAEFCGLAENEKFSNLLDRVDGIVQTVKDTKIVANTINGVVSGINSTVGNINSAVNNIKTTVDNICILFCSSDR